MNTRSFTVVDDAHRAMGQTLQELCELLDEGIQEYISILTEVTSEAAKCGHTTTRYQEYAGVISGLKGEFRRLGNTLNTTAVAFVSEIDGADEYLY